MPSLPTGPAAVTSRTSPQKHCCQPTQSLPPALFPTPFTPTQSAWLRQLIGTSSGESSRNNLGCFLELFSDTTQSWEEINWGETSIWGWREIKVKLVVGTGRECWKLWVCKNKTSPVVVPPVFTPPPPLYFITCVFLSPILPVLSAVSKIDWGLLVIWNMLVWLLARAHKVFVWAVKVSPECLFAFCWIFITYLMLFPSPGELDSASNTPYPRSLFLFPFFYTPYCHHPCFFSVFLWGAWCAVLSAAPQSRKSRFVSYSPV